MLCCIHRRPSHKTLVFCDYSFRRFTISLKSVRLKCIHNKRVRGLLNYYYFKHLIMTTPNFRRVSFLSADRLCAGVMLLPVRALSSHILSSHVASAIRNKAPMLAKRDCDCTLETSRYLFLKSIRYQVKSVNIVIIFCGLGLVF